MATRTECTIRGWVQSRCTGCRLRLGSRRRENLLRKIGKIEGARASHRLDRTAVRYQGAEIYRRFKWDPALVSARTRALCQRLVRLEDHLSQVVREIGGRPHRPSGARHAMACHPPAIHAAAMR